MFRQKVCCGIVYKGRYGEILIDPHLYKPCYQRKPKPHQQQKESGEMEDEMEDQETGSNTVHMSPSYIPKQEEGVEEKGQHDEGAR